MQERKNLVAEPATRERDGEVRQQRKLRSLLVAKRGEHLPFGSEKVWPPLE
jgi:hypothetical protein